MNTTQTNPIRGLSTADFIKLNFVTFVQQVVGQALLALICAAFVLLPDSVIGITLVIVFAAAWFGGQHLGNKTIKMVGAETAKLMTGISFRWAKVMLTGTLAAFFVVLGLVVLIGGAHPAIALCWVNLCFVTVAFFYWLEVASAPLPEKEEYEINPN